MKAKSIVLNAFLRGVTLISKFAIMLLLAKEFEVVEFGTLSLSIAFITLFAYLIGFEIHTHTLSEISRISEENTSLRFSKGLLKVAIIGVLLGPLVFFVSTLSGLSESLSFLVAITSISEALCAQLNWYLTYQNRQILASVVLFFRSTAWGVAIFIASFSFGINMSTKVALQFWFLSSTLVFALAFISSMKPKIDDVVKWFCWSGLSKSIKYAFPLLISILASRALFSVDKIVIESLINIEQLAVYSLFVTLGYATMSLIDSTITVFNYKKILTVVSNHNENSFRLYRGLIVTSLLTATIVSLVGSMVMIYIVRYFDDGVYSSSISVLSFVVLPFVFFSTSSISNHFLFGLGLRKQHLIINLLGVGSFVSITYLCSLIKSVDLEDVCITLLFVSICQLIFRSVTIYRKLNKVDDKTFIGA
ncbi:hypothetical protein FCL40_17900 [Ferrimonas sediminicola]|uniref:Membrane protein involved in the export of O-antigen and teichoic acid n=1 Tax=Ferrimonas sediminicola TaxID=2569538 RepID=A0A4U1B8X2_9GAMM|nr:oligosaccharide flippase family protein [Ferrimonas sediminicola]TKB46467.1 hypothetical protein FCL40_17900 [Ferrimonas sediminicola]